MMKTFVLSAALIALLSACGSSEPEPATQEAAAPAIPAFEDDIDVGPKVGTALPAIVLKSEDGANATLASVAGDKGSVLFFVRSADWCPYCKKQLQEIAPLQAQLSELGLGMAAISYDEPATLKGYADEHDLPYPLLSDKGSKLIDALELRDPQYTDGFAAGVPYASVLVVDADGKVTGRIVAENFRIRPSNEQILELANQAVSS